MPASPIPRRTARAAALATLAAALLLVHAAPLAAQSPRERLLVEPAWLAAHLQDPNLVVLQVGEKGGYDSAHVPGARFIRLQDLSTPHDMHDEKSLMLEMPSPEVMRGKLEALGISDRSRVVVVYGADWVSPATRVVMDLTWAGLGDRVSLLDGGLDAWRAERRPVTRDVPAPAQGTLAPLHTANVIVDAEWVRAHVATRRFAIVDARAPAFYDGVQKTATRAGHVPSARSIPFTELTDDHNRVRSNAELAAVFQAAGVKPGDTVVGYCHIGQQATAMLFAARLLGYDFRLYDGSFQDWDRRTDLPVELPPARGAR
jgi:thiosulfate/3-mercaptopyruvate sulfurtransferase